jgi:hypothetical protein
MFVKAYNDKSEYGGINGLTPSETFNRSHNIRSFAFGVTYQANTNDTKQKSVTFLYKYYMAYRFVT